MFRYLPGVVLVQVVTIALFWANLGAPLEQLLIRVGLPAAVIGVITALWLSTIGRMEAERRHAGLIEKHAKERERLNRLIERTRSDVLEKASADRAKLIERNQGEKERLVEKTHKQIIQRERSVSRRANFKIGFAYMAVTGFGVLMLMTELLTLGLVTIMTAGGAMGGYLFRWRQGRQSLDRISKAADTPFTVQSDGDSRQIRVYEGSAKRVSDLDPIALDATSNSSSEKASSTAN